MNVFIPDMFGKPEISINEMIEKSINLVLKLQDRSLEMWEGGFHVANSFGKDSGLIKKIVQLSGVKFQDFHNQTTIDPPELWRFGMKEHSDCVINKAHMNIFARIVEKGLPTRQGRWCCEEYKESKTGLGRMVVLGVRKAESKAREARWQDVQVWRGSGAQKVCVNPILNYTDAQVWEAHEQLKIPYCCLYDEGFDRLGCIGCPLASKYKIDKEFERWPKYKELWKRAAIRHWELRAGTLNRRGELYAVTKFKCGEDYFYWWENRLKMPNYEGCLFGMI